MGSHAPSRSKRSASRLVNVLLLTALTAHTRADGSVGPASAAEPGELVVRTRATHPFWIVVQDPRTDPQISKRIANTGFWDVHVLRLLEHIAIPACRQPGGALVADVGTNLGFFTNALLAMGCHVSGFEMQPAQAARVMRSARINDAGSRLSMHVGAVSNTSGVTLHRLGTADGMIFKPGFNTPEQAHGPTTETMTLDGILIPKGRPIEVMKVDIEGHEPQAFRGATQLFERGLVKHLVLEFSPMVFGLDEGVRMLTFLHSHFKFVSEAHFLYCTDEDFSKPFGAPTICPVDTSTPGWQRNFTARIMGLGSTYGGDSRGLRLTELWMSNTEQYTALSSTQLQACKDYMSGRRRREVEKAGRKQLHHTRVTVGLALAAGCSVLLLAGAWKIWLAA